MRDPHRIARVLFAISIGSLSFYMVRDYRSPIVVLNASVEPKDIAAGEDFTVRVQIKANRDCPSVLFRSLVSQSSGGPVQLYNPVPMEYSGDVIEYHDIHVPHGFSVGKAVLKAQQVFTCNWIQRLVPIKVELPPLELNVLPEDTEHGKESMKKSQEQESNNAVVPERSTVAHEKSQHPAEAQAMGKGGKLRPE